MFKLNHLFPLSHLISFILASLIHSQASRTHSADTCVSVKNSVHTLIYPQEKNTKTCSGLRRTNVPSHVEEERLSIYNRPAGVYPAQIPSDVT